MTPVLVLVAVLLAGLGGIRLGVEIARDETPSAPPAAAPRPPAPAPAPDPLRGTPVQQRLRAEFGVDRVTTLDLVVGPLAPRMIADEVQRSLGPILEVSPSIVESFGDRTSELVPGETFVERATTEDRAVGDCRLVHRSVQDVIVGIEGEVGERIAVKLLRAADSATLFDYEGTRTTFPHPAELLRDACGEPILGDIRDFYAVEEVVPVPCGLPERELRCYSVSRYVVASGVLTSGTYGFSSIAGHVLVFDRATGELLQRDALYPGLTVAEGDRLIELLLRDHFVGRVLNDRGAPFAENPTQWGSIVPTAEGLAYVEMFEGLSTPLGVQVGKAVLSWDLVRRAAEFRAGLGPDGRIDPVWGVEGAL